MAVALEGFSIRGYTSKMRSINLGKCWPFDGDGKENGEGGEKGRSLPPISLRNFRWWSDELEAAARSKHAGGGKTDEAGSGHELEKVRHGEESHNELMGEILSADGCVGQVKTPVKTKQRTPKKRSIAELFAVAPPVEIVAVEAVGDDVDQEQDQEDVDGGEDRNGELDEGRLEMRGFGGLVSAKKIKERVKEDAKKAMVKKKKWLKEKNIRRKKKKLKVEMAAAKKEKIHKPKMTTSVQFSHTLQDFVHKTWFGRASRNPVDCRTKPTRVKSLQKKHKFKIQQTTKLTSRNRREVAKLLPVPSILKNPTRGTAVKKASLKASTQGGHLPKFCCESARHVTFSGKDDILGHNKSCSPMKLPQSQNICKIFSDIFTASSAMSNPSKSDELPVTIDGTQVVNVSNTDVDTRVIERTYGSLSEKKQLSYCHSHAIPPMFVSPSNRSCPDTEKTSSAVSVDLNQTTQSCSDLNCYNAETLTLFSRDTFSDDPKVLYSARSEQLNSASEIHVEESFPRTTASRFLPNPISCVSQSDTMSSLSIVRNTSSPHSNSCLVMRMDANGRQDKTPAYPKMDICCHIPEFQTMSNLSSKDSLSSICSSAGSKKYGDSCVIQDQASIYKDKCRSEDFIGLPLNSQGELMQLHSGTKFGFAGFYKKQNVLQSPIHNFRVPNYVEPINSLDNVRIMKGKFPDAALCQKGHSSWFQEKYHPVSTPAPSGLGFTDLRSFEGMEAQNHERVKDKDKAFCCNSSPMKVSCHGCRENTHSHNCIDRVNFQAEGKLDHVFQPAIQRTMRLMGKTVTVGRSNKECPGYDDGRIRTDKGITEASDKTLPKEWLHNEWVEHPASGTSQDNLLQRLAASSSFYSAQAIEPRSGHMHFGYRPQWISRNGISSTIRNHDFKADLFSHPLPQQGFLNETPRSTVSSSGAESVKMVQQIPVVVSSPQNVYQHKLLSSTHCKHSQSVPYGTSSTFNPPFLYQGLGSFAEPSLSQSSPNLPQWLLNAKQQKKKQQSCCSANSDPLVAHRPCNESGTNLFLFPSPYPTSMIPFPCYNNTFQTRGVPTPIALHPSFITAFTARKSRPVPNNTYRSKTKNRGPNSTSNIFKGLNNDDKTRKRPADNESMKPVKKPCLSMQKDSYASAGSRGREQMHGYMQYSNKKIDVGLPLMVCEEDRFRTAPGSSSLKFDGGTRVGPMKLSGGAKHILEPSQGMDQDDGRPPVHSTIPFSVGNSSGEVLVPQKKAAKVYRF